ncbi:MAG: hypothetical protein A2W17_08240 [Planctomycetes bacterium RBG_16_41_13]|nr:MAG: hypothetical protein A2W17_08240 [Planctomycetes bacterium RBG_16_41_13]
MSSYIFVIVAPLVNYQEECINERENILCCSLFLKIFLKALIFLDKKDFTYNIYSLNVSYLNTYSSQNFHYFMEILEHILF